MNLLDSAKKRTIYFIGVTTGQSSIMRVFPRWASFLDLGECEIVGLDFPLNAPVQSYREAVAFIKSDPLSLGALVTTHKLDLFRASRDLFDEVDAYAGQLEEVSCISKKNGRLVAHAKDPISSALSLDRLLSPDRWDSKAGQAFVIGAGGSGVAIALNLLTRSENGGRSQLVQLSDRNPDRLSQAKVTLDPISSAVRYELALEAEANDALLDRVPSGSLIINATGLGKDSPGSPFSDNARFPFRGIVWELNYRGELRFLAQAKAQQAERSLTVEDGWNYFIYGWSSVISQVFHKPIPATGPVFDRLLEIARESAPERA